MKQKKFDLRVHKILDNTETWCKENNFQSHRNGPYSLYIDGKQISDDLQVQIKDYLSQALNLTIKQLKKMLCFILTGGRLYILFKNKVELQ